MEIFARNPTEVMRAIKAGRRSDYIYMYPPRQAYRPLSLNPARTEQLVKGSLGHSAELNLYVHVPFCKQICNFCNLYTTAIKDENVHEHYVRIVCEQIERFPSWGTEPLIRSVYIGGGTPSLLASGYLRRILASLRSRFPNWSSDAEIALEVDPQTVDKERLHSIREVGFNRINLGLQSSALSELVSIGRRYEPEGQAATVNAAMEAGFENVCLDLIYGLPNQTVASFMGSIRSCINFGAQTICCYPLTSRPFTGYSKHGLASNHDESYEMWTLADDILRSSGYRRESHVRWAKPNGGYRQKELHWGMQNLLGFGAGARSYLWDVDLRWGYSVRDRKSALDKYFEDMTRLHDFPSEGFLMSEEERIHKRAVLGLNKLDVTESLDLVGVDVLEHFSSYFDFLISSGFGTLTNSVFMLTAEGVKWRDVLVQPLISDRVFNLVSTFDYSE
jgi:oxygen-independent coproporphyrinogen III oxidase